MNLNKILSKILFLLELIVLIMAVYFIVTKNLQEAILDTVIAMYYDLLRKRIEESERRKNRKEEK